jgi:hypothetical protein
MGGATSSGAHATSALLALVALSRVSSSHVASYGKIFMPEKS